MCYGVLIELTLSVTSKKYALAFLLEQQKLKATPGFTVIVNLYLTRCRHFLHFSLHRSAHQQILSDRWFGPSTWTIFWELAKTAKSIHGFNNKHRWIRTCWTPWKRGWTTSGQQWESTTRQRATQSKWSGSNWAYSRPCLKPYPELRGIPAFVHYCISAVQGSGRAPQLEDRIGAFSRGPWSSSRTCRSTTSHQWRPVGPPQKPLKKPKVSEWVSVYLVRSHDQTLTCHGRPTNKSRLLNYWEKFTFGALLDDSLLAATAFRNAGWCLSVWDISFGQEKIFCNP